MLSFKYPNFRTSQPINQPINLFLVSSLFSFHYARPKGYACFHVFCLTVMWCSVYTYVCVLSTRLVNFIAIAQKLSYF